MKKSILNRPMFRQVKSPAYGTGISANLVSSEERQKYNYGGRVRAQQGLYYTSPMELEYEDISENNPWIKEPIEERKRRGPYLSEEQQDVLSTTPIISQGQQDYLEGLDLPYVDPKETLQEQLDKENLAAAQNIGAAPIKGESDLEDGVEIYEPEHLARTSKLIDKKEKLLAGVGDGAGTGVVDDTTMLDLEGIVDKYYDKEGSLGQAQLGLAGQVLKAGFQPKKEAMGTLGDAMGAFGTSIQKDKDAMKKLAATGEVQRELYRISRAEEGRQDRMTADFKAKLPEDIDNLPLAEQFKYTNAAAFKAGFKGDERLSRVLDFVLPGSTIKTLKGGKGKSLEADQAAITAAGEDTLFIKDQKIWKKDKNNILRVVSFEELGLVEPQS